MSVVVRFALACRSQRWAVMKPFRSLLAPVDFSDTTRESLALAGEIARKFDCTMTLLHVYGVPVMPVPEAGGVGTDLVDQIVRSAREGVERLASALADLGVPAQPVLIEGAPARTIVEYAGEHDIDLIVMGTHGRTGLDHVISGSVAEKVVRHAPCPVLTVRA